MSEGMAELAKKYVGNISARGVLYIEAVEMITNGYALIDKGEKALEHLEGKKTKSSNGYGGTQGGRLAKAPMKPRERMQVETRSQAQLIARVQSILVKGEHTAREVAAKLNCGYARALAVLNETKGVTRVGEGNQVRWMLANRTHTLSRKSSTANRTVKRSGRSEKTRRQASCKAADPAQQKADEDKIVSLLKETPELTMMTFMKKLKRSFYPVERALKNLVKEGRLKPIKVKTENGSERQSWEVV
jgi:hypothetical protein